MMRKTFAIASLLFIAFSLHAQVPANDDLANAQALTLDGSGNYCSSDAEFTTLLATFDGTKPSNWANNNVLNVWFKFTPNASGIANIKVKNGDVYGTAGYQMTAIYDDQNQEISSVRHTTRRNNSGLVVSGLDPAKEYFINVASRNINNGPGTFTLCISSQEDFDYRASAQTLTLDGNGDYCSTDGEFTTLDATPDYDQPINASQGPNQNIWFKFKPASNGLANIVVSRGHDLGSLGFPILALYDENGVEVNSIFQNKRYLNAGILAETLDPSKDYFISVDAKTVATGPGNFTLCIRNEKTNDFKDEATELTLDVNGEYVSADAEYSNQNASSDDNAGSTWTEGPYQNVWFKFKPASNGMADIQVHRGSEKGTAGYLMLALFDDAGQEVLSASNDVRNANIGFLAENLDPARDYFIAVDAMAKLNGAGTFTLEIKNNATFDYIEGATELTLDANGDYCSANEEFTIVGATPDGMRPSNWVEGPNQNVWFKFKPDANGLANIAVSRGTGLGSMGFAMLALYDDAGVEVASAANDIRYHNIGLVQEGLDPDRDYFIAIDALAKATAPGTFTLCITNERDYNFLANAQEVVLDGNGFYLSANAEFSNESANVDPNESAATEWTEGPNQNVWFKFKPYTNGVADIMIQRGDAKGTSGFLMAALYDDAGQEVTSASNDIRSLDLGLYAENLDPAKDYFLAVDAMAKLNGPGSFTLQIESQVTYDFMQGAVELTLDANGDYCSANAEYSTVDATPDGNRPNMWVEGPNQNVWFKFKPDANGLANITIKRGNDYGTLGYAMLALFDDTGAEVDSKANDVRHKNIGLVAQGLDPARDYFITVDALVKTFGPGTFSLCILNELTSDYQIEAQELSLDTEGNYISADAEFTTEGATGDGLIFQNWTEGPNNNVWFRFRPIASGDYSILVSRGGSKGTGAYFQVGLIDGDDNEIDSEGSESINAINQLTGTGLSADTDYFITVDNRAQGNRWGSFTLELQYTPPPCTVEAVSIFLDENGVATLSESDFAQDGCNWPCPSGDCALTIAQTSFDCSDLGLNQVLITGQDDQGNVFSQNLEVNVVDAIPPVLTVSNRTFHVGFDGSTETMLAEDFVKFIGDSSEPEEPSPGARNESGPNLGPPLLTYDNCEIVSFELVGPNTYTCDDFGFHDVTIIARDQSGNETSMTTFVQVVPEHLALDYNSEITLALDENGEVDLTLDQVDNGTHMVCGLESEVLPLIGNTHFTCDNLGENLVEIRANRLTPALPGESEVRVSAVGRVTVTVIDNLPPVVVLKNPTINITSNMTLQIYPSDLLVMESEDGNYTRDNCGDLILPIWEGDDAVVLTPADAGVLSYTIDVADNQGNVTTVTATATLAVVPCANQLWAIASGDWNDPNTWSATEGGPPLGTIPCENTEVIIKNHYVSHNSDETFFVKNITLIGTNRNIRTRFSVIDGLINVLEYVDARGPGVYVSAGGRRSSGRIVVTGGD